MADTGVCPTPAKKKTPRGFSPGASQLQTRNLVKTYLKYMVFALTRGA